MEKYKEIVEKVSSKGDKSDMELLACMIGEFIDEMEERHPEKVQNFMLAMEDEFSFFLTEREA